MKTLFSASILLCVALLFASERPGYTDETAPQAQPAQPAAPDTAQPADETKPPRKAPRGRLPNYYGKLDLSGEQRDKIYGVQANYNGQIEALERQIAELKAKRDRE